MFAKLDAEHPSKLFLRFVSLDRIGQPYPTPPQPPGPDLLSETAYDNSKACGSSAPPGLAMAKRAADSRY